MSLRNALIKYFENNKSVEIKISKDVGELIGFVVDFKINGRGVSHEGVIVKEWLDVHSFANKYFSAIEFMKRQPLLSDMFESMVHTVVSNISVEERAEALHLYEDHENSLLVDEGITYVCEYIFNKLVIIMEENNNDKKKA